MGSRGICKAKIYIHYCENYRLSLHRIQALRKASDVLFWFFLLVLFLSYLSQIFFTILQLNIDVHLFSFIPANHSLIILPNEHGRDSTSCSTRDTYNSSVFLFPKIHQKPRLWSDSEFHSPLALKPTQAFFSRFIIFIFQHSVVSIDIRCRGQGNFSTDKEGKFEIMIFWFYLGIAGAPSY